MTQEDIPAWAALLAAAEEVDRTGEHYDEADLVEEFGDPAIGPDDRLSGWIDGELVAFAGVRPRGSVADHHRLDCEGAVHPSWRGNDLGSHLVRWIIEHCAQIHEERSAGVEARMQTLAFLDNHAQVGLLESYGFAPVTWSAVMRVGLRGRDIPVPEWPDGMTLFAYAPRWSKPMHEAHNAAFVDHAGFVAWTDEMWQQHVDGSRSLRAAQSWILIDDAQPDRVIGYVQSNEFEAYQAATGRREAYLAKIGVRPEYRGRGLGSLLLRHALREYQAAGYDESSLDVDTNNPTGAFGLYTRLGYEIERRTAIFERVLPPVDEMQHRIVS
jgi:mycothiol synthase